MKNRLPILLALTWAWGISTLVSAQSPYNIYYGDFHSHTWYSDGNQDQNMATYTQPVARAITYARTNANSMNFLGVSDHNHNEGGLHMNLNYWRAGNHEADSVNQDGVFVGMRGQEWGVISGGGHVCVYGTDKLFGWDAGIYDVFVAKSNYSMLWDSVKKYGGFCYLAHPQSGDFGGIFSGAYNALADSVIQGVAIRSGPASSTTTDESDPSSSDYQSRYHDLLRLGYHVAPCAHQDNHNTTFGRVNQQRTAVLATSLTQANVLDALRNRRVYATMDHNLQLRLEVGTHQMGEIFTTSSPFTVRIVASDPDGEHMSSIELRYGVPGSGIAPTALTSNSGQDSLIFTPSQAINTTYYYYAYVTEPDGQHAWSAPVWITTAAAAPPVAFSQSSPANAAVNQSVSGTLSWQSSSGATQYDVYLDGSNPPTTIVSANQAGTSYAYSGLSTSSTYYWKIVAKNVTGSTTATGAPWNFTTIPPSPGAFTLVSPASGATGQSLSGTLSWQSSTNATQYDVYLGTVNPPTTVVSPNQAGTSYPYTGLSNGTVYYWKVVAKNSGGSTTGTGAPWNFTTIIAPPGSFNLLAPANSAVNQALNGTLSWQASAGVSQYDVYLDQSNPPTTIVSPNQSATTYSYSGLSTSSTYYWKVVAKNVNGSTTSTAAPWNFQSLPPGPGAFNLLSPAAGSANQPLSGTIAWQSSSNATGYDVYLDGSNPPMTVVSTNQAGTSYPYSGLSSSTQYFWKVVAKNVAGTSTATGSPWNFTTVPPVPGAFDLSAPSNGAGAQPVNGTISWQAASNASQYDVYLDNTNPPTTLVSSNQAGTSYPYSGLSNNLVYYWKVVAKNISGNTAATTAPWSFTTVMTPPSAFDLLAPANGSVDQPLTGALSWNASANATGYDVYLDNNNPPTTIVSSNQAMTSYPFNGLSTSSTYYWKVVAKNNGGTIASTGVPWNFSTVPPAPAGFNLLSPVNGSSSRPLSDTLTWDVSANAAQYDVYLDTHTSPVTLVGSNLTSPAFVYSGLATGTIYYWKVVARNTGGTATSNSAPWSFSTIAVNPPASFSRLSPANGAADQPLSGTISWQASANATQYDVYFDTNNPPTTLVSSNQPGTSYSYGPVAYHTTYYWSVVAKNNLGTLAATGAPWNFSTTSLPGAFNLVSPSANATGQSLSGMLTWEPSQSANSYDVYIDVNNPPTVLATSNVSGTSCPFSNISSGTTYYWKVVAKNQNGTMPATNAPRSFSTAQFPVSATNANASFVSGNSIHLLWQDNANDEDGYRVYRSTVSGGSFLQDGSDLPQNSVSFIDSPLVANQRYYYRILPYNNIGEGNFTELNIVTLASIPGPPSESNFSYNSLTLSIDPGDNPPATQLAVPVTVDGTTYFLQQGGTLGASPVWLTFAQWGGAGGILVKGLHACKQYSFATMAGNDDGVESPAGAASTFILPCAELTATVQGGWNLVSVPYAVTDLHHSIVFPASTSSAFSYQGGYVTADQLAYGRGYWMKFPAGAALNLSGDPRASESLSLDAGWNLIGSVADPVSVSAIGQLPAGIVASAVFGYDGGYTVVDSIRPMHAYWIKARQSGTIVFSSSGNAGKASAGSLPGGAWEGVAKQSDAFTFDDGQSHRQTLYIARPGGTDMDLTNFEAPPLPPAGSFDVRFSSQRFVEILTASGEVKSRILPVSVQSGGKPVTFSWQVDENPHVTYRLISGSRSLALGTKGTLVLPANVEEISFEASTQLSPAVPAEFSLQQNYPNPFNPSTDIRYDLPVSSQVHLAIYNAIGTLVDDLLNEVQAAGTHSIHWMPDLRQNGTNSGKGVATGVYFYRLDASSIDNTRPGYHEVRKMVFLK